ncbi:MAG: VanZ family protein [Flavobacteriaceae bacterium]|nr:VanZ family protein [Flavobacteriaceae bacterium]
MTRLTKKLLAPKFLYFLGISYSLLVTILFLMPAQDVPEVTIPFLDKLVHVLIFSILSFIWLLIFRNSSKIIHTILWICLIIWCYGIIIELLQQWFFDTRNADSWDVVANSVGILTGVLLFQRIKARFSLKK